MIYLRASRLHTGITCGVYGHSRWASGPHENQSPSKFSKCPQGISHYQSFSRSRCFARSSSRRGKMSL